MAAFSPIGHLLLLSLFLRMFVLNCFTLLYSLSQFMSLNFLALCLLLIFLIVERLLEDLSLDSSQSMPVAW